MSGCNFVSKLNRLRKSSSDSIDNVDSFDGFKEYMHVVRDEEKDLKLAESTSCGKLVPELKKVKYDMLSMSAHKMYGPQGVGALVLRKKRYKLPPVKAIMYGGQQEHGIRPGTTPVALVAGLGKACELAESEYGENSAALIRVKETVLKLIEKSGLEYTFNGDQNYCLSNTINVGFKGVESEALMHSSKQYCGISNGSACTSHDYSPSYVLKAMGLDEERLSEAIRISWGPKTVVEEIEKELSDLLSVAKALAG